MFCSSTQIQPGLLVVLCVYTLDLSKLIYQLGYYVLYPQKTYTPL